jgi:hypothetical protein
MHICVANLNILSLAENAAISFMARMGPRKLSPFLVVHPAPESLSESLAVTIAATTSRPPARTKVM